MPLKMGYQQETVLWECRCTTTLHWCWVEYTRAFRRVGSDQASNRGRLRLVAWGQHRTHARIGHRQGDTDQCAVLAYLAVLDQPSAHLAGGIGQPNGGSW